MTDSETLRDPMAPQASEVAAIASDLRAELEREAERNENMISTGEYHRRLAAIPEHARAAVAKMDNLSAEQDEWTREATIARRAAWNDAVKSGRHLNNNGTVHMASLTAAMGFSLEDLRRSVKRHGL
jgi:hypothetical protein